MEQRPILVAMIGYIIGILWGLYLKSSIVPFYILIIALYFIIKRIKHKEKRKFKLLSIYRYSRYFKLIITKKVIIILMLFSSISNFIVLWQNNKYANTYKDGQNLNIQGIIISQKIEKQYYNLYQLKELNSKNFNLYIQVDKQTKLEYGDKVQLQGTYKKPSKRSNYGGYDDEQYLKTLKIVGRIKVEQIEVVEKNQQNFIFQCANNINLKLKENIDSTYNDEQASLLKGLLLGDTTKIEEEIKENFRNSNIAHILAISGMHIVYIIKGIEILFKKIIGKRKTKIVTLFVLVAYVFITGFSPSIIRAVIMGGLVIGAGVIYRKNDVWNSIGISLLGILIYNPFLIYNVGLQLSYMGTIGILLFNKVQVEGKIKEILIVSLSAQIVISPITLYHFNTFGIYFLITNILVSIIIGPIILFGFFSLIFKPFSLIVKMGLDILKLISSFSNLPFSKVYVATPSIFSIVLYFVVILTCKWIYKIYKSTNLTATQKRVKNLIALFRYKIYCNKKKFLKFIFVILFFCLIFVCIPKNLKIYFVDVEQGDCTFIVTPHNTTILIDGGGSLEDFDVGKKTLIPYLLDRGYTSIDYLIISHYDQDHVRGLTYCFTGIKSK